MNELPLFEIISADEFKKGQQQTTPRKGSKFNTTDRTYTNWFKLPHRIDFCTVPSHEDVIRALTPENKEYRQTYPVRMVFTIDNYDVCRDCWIMEADLLD